MIFLHTKYLNLGVFWRVLEMNMLVYFMSIWYIWWLFGAVYVRLVHCVSHFGVLYQLKAGNPDEN
jgi:hypothetical protein